MILQSMIMIESGAGFLYVNRRESFMNVVKWLGEVRKYCDTEVQVILVGNKTDMEDK